MRAVSGDVIANSQSKKEPVMSKMTREFQRHARAHTPVSC